MAGQGVEFGWGKAKQHLPRHDTMDNKTFKNRVINYLIKCMDTSGSFDHGAHAQVRAARTGLWKRIQGARASGLLPWDRKAGKAV
jgi:hypothetical protein